MCTYDGRMRRGLIGLCCLLLLVACGGGGQQGTSVPQTGIKDGGTLTVALLEEPDQLDPTTAQTLVGREVFSTFCEKLYDVDAKLQIVPQLAAAMPQVSADGLSVTIKVRQGLKFNDGTPFDAGAVKTSLDRDLTLPTSTRKSEISSIKDVQVTDPSTIQIDLKQPFAPLTAALADRAGMVMSPTQLLKLGTGFASSPICVGPFTLTERVPNDHITLTRSQYYYDKGKVHLDKIVYKFIPDENVRLANVSSGAAQIGERMAATDVDKMKRDPNLGLLQATTLGYQGIDLNVGNANGAGKAPGTVDTPFARSPQLRQAFALAIDRDTINRVVFQGRNTPGCTPISPTSPYRDSRGCPRADVQRAKQLVSQSGVATPIHVNLTVANNTDATRLGQVIQSMEKQVGFDVAIQPQEFVTTIQAGTSGHFEALQVGWSGRIDPDQNIYQEWHTAGSLNYTGASDPQIDHLLEQARATSDTGERKKLYGQLTQRLQQEGSLIYLYHDVYNLAVNKKVSGVQFYSDGIPRVAFAGLTS
jgi:peptide/nickel transport system substrate-binding protein